MYMTKDSITNIMKKQIYIDREHSEPPQKGKIIRRLFKEYINTNHYGVASFCIHDF